MALEPFATRAFRFACAVVKLHLELQSAGRVPPRIAGQFLAAGTSVAANLEEAKAAQSRRDVAAKFSIALKEARETAYWLRLLRATHLVEERRTADLNQEAHELVAILTVALRRLRNQEDPGRPYTSGDQTG